jgi:ribosomal protein S27E
MGLILGAHCNCGFDQKFDFGSNLFDFSDHCLAPAICTHCNKFQIINYLEDEPFCIDCGHHTVFYNDPSLQLDPEMGKLKFAISWLVNPRKGRFILPPTRYKCPECGKLKMQFRNCGCWET